MTLRLASSREMELSSWFREHAGLVGSKLATALKFGADGYIEDLDDLIADLNVGLDAI